MSEHYKALNYAFKKLGYETPYEFYAKCTFNSGNFLKYLARHKYKGKPKQDLIKALNYFNGMVSAGLRLRDCLPEEIEDYTVLILSCHKMLMTYNDLCFLNSNFIFRFIFKSKIKSKTDYIRQHIEQAISKYE